MAIVGFLVGHSGGGGGEPATPANSMSNGDLTLGIPSEWERTSNETQIPGLRFSEPVGLQLKGRSDAGATAGMVNGSGRTLLPADFRGRLDRQPRTDGNAVRVGDLEGYRYRNLRASGFSDVLTMYVIPTSAGVATLACHSPNENATAFERDCERVATTLELDTAKAFPLGPSDDYASTLSDQISSLNDGRAVARKELSKAKTPGGQSKAAEKASSAYGEPATALRRAEVTPEIKDANEKIVVALMGAERAYKELATAAAKGRRGAYRKASKAITRQEAAVKRALDSLEGRGYTIGSS